MEAIATGLWAADAELRMMGMRMPIRMAVCQLESGGLLLHSPVPIDDELADAIAAIGTVEHIVAPNLMHHLHVPAAQSRYPDATLWAPEGIEGKNDALGQARPLREIGDALATSLTGVEIEGQPKLREHVFVHHASRALICSDYLFNVVEARGWMAKAMFSMSGVRGRLAQSRIWHSWVKDRQSAAKSTLELLEHDFDVLVPGHGDVIASGAKDRVAEATGRIRQYAA